MYIDLLISLSDPTDTNFTAELVGALESVLPPNYDVNVNEDPTQDNKQNVTRLLNEIFDVIIVITMFLCLFALSANMSANIN